MFSVQSQGKNVCPNDVVIVTITQRHINGMIVKVATVKTSIHMLNNNHEFVSVLINIANQWSTSPTQASIIYACLTIIIYLIIRRFVC